MKLHWRKNVGGSFNNWVVVIEAFRIIDWPDWLVEMWDKANFQYGLKMNKRVGCAYIEKVNSLTKTK